MNNKMIISGYDLKNYEFRVILNDKLQITVTYTWLDV